MKSLRDEQIQRVCVKVAQQTLTLYVRVRILHPLPKEAPGIVEISGAFPCFLKTASKSRRVLSLADTMPLRLPLEDSKGFHLFSVQGTGGL